jgi:CDGSH-type Zn-finger protein
VWQERVNGRSSGHRTGMGADRVTITPYRDGPLLVRGPFTLVDQDGNEIAVDREVVALCRCGKSRIKPLCDSTHKVVGFKAPSRPARPGAPEAS